MKRYYFILLLAWAGGVKAQCDRRPPRINFDSNSRDGKFHLSIDGNSEAIYRPYATYLVKLESEDKKSFTGFTVTARNYERGDTYAGKLEVAGSGSLTKYSNSCPNSITADSGIPKYQVKMRWIAPAPGSGCVSLQASVLERNDIWYQDEEGLTRTLCEDNSDVSRWIVLDECPATKEAKYEVSFRGMWSRNTHPRHFPENEWETRYSDLIGASHSADYLFWSQGQTASDGLKKLAEFSATDELENELLQQIGAEDRKVRTIIKAKGQKFPDRNAETFAIFRVDSKYHIVSMVTAIEPSPDWFLGVSRIELCLPNGSWIEQMSIKLYPWDAGTDSGVTYKSQNDPTYPPVSISRLRVDSPNNPDSAFYEPGVKEMKPFAMLTFKLLREYDVVKPTVEENDEQQENREDNAEIEEKQSRSDGRTSLPPEESPEETPSSGEADVSRSAGAGGGCPRMSAWSDWTECEGVQGDCGEAVQFRLRHVLINQPRDAPPKENGECDFDSQDRRDCVPKCYENIDDGAVTSSRFTGPVTNVGVTGDGSLTGKDGPAQKTYFSNYQGKRSKNNDYSRHNDPYKRNVNQNYFNGMNVESLVLSAGGNKVPVYVSPDNSKDCKVSRWSEWSMCRGDCGVGVRTRFRRIVRHSQNGGKACPAKLVKQKKCLLPPCIEE